MENPGNRHYRQKSPTKPQPSSKEGLGAGQLLDLGPRCDLDSITRMLMRVGFIYKNWLNCPSVWMAEQAALGLFIQWNIIQS